MGDLLGILCVLLLFGEVGDEAVGALHGEENSDRAANTGVPTGDDGALALELASSLVLLSTSLGCGELIDLGERVELGLETGGLLMLNIRLEACHIGSVGTHGKKLGVYLPCSNWSLLEDMMRDCCMGISELVKSL